MPEEERGEVIPNVKYLVIDTETIPDYGFSPMRTDIIEIGWAFVSGDAITEEGSSLVRSEAQVPLNMTRKRGFTKEMLESAPVFSDIFPSLVTKATGTVIVGHNLSYDMRVIRDVANRKLGERDAYLLSAFEAIPWLDTQKLFTRLFPNEPNKRLKDLLRVLNIEEREQRHRAGADAKYTAQALIKMITLAQLGHEITGYVSLKNFSETGHTFYQSTLF